MEKEIISTLQLYKKPDKNFLKDKECLICLETIDLEFPKIVKLPCGCSNSVYHIVCIAQLLVSGENKNFCPHCKSNYEITLQQVVHPSVHIVIQPNNENAQTKQLSFVIIVHIFSNSVMNFINIGMSADYPENNANIISKILQISYFCKILVNVCIVINLKTDNEKIETHLFLSYTIQTILFVLLVCLLCIIKNDFKTILLMLNNIFFSLTDLAFRICVEYKRVNRVDIEA